MLSREQILAPRPVEVHSIEIPEWGGTVNVRVPSPRQMESYEEKNRKLEAAGNLLVGLRARIAILVCCDMDGNPLFSATDEAALMEGPNNVTALKRIADWVAPRVGWSDAEIEDRAKNSQQTEEEDSSSV